MSEIKRMKTNIKVQWRGTGGAVVGVLFALLVALYAGPVQAAFSDATETRGIGLDGSDAAGIAWGDYDGDDDEDLYVTRQEKQNSLYQNNGSGVFKDVTLEAGVQNPSLGCEAWGAAWGDYDNDGDLDLYVTYETGCANRLYQNHGGTFSEVAVRAGVDQDSGIAHKPSRTASWADVNQDGLLDLYVANRGGESPDAADRNVLYQNKGDGTFEDVAGDLHVDGGTTLSFTGVWSDYDNDGDLDLFVASDFHGLELFRNDGAGLFLRVTATAFAGKLVDSLGPPTPGPQDPQSPQPTDCIENIPSDGHRVPNSEYGKSSHSHCLLDEPAVGLVPDTPTYGALPFNAMGLCAGDYDNDGFMDYYVTNFTADDYRGAAQDKHGKLESALWHNKGDGTFTEGARDAHLNKLVGTETRDLSGNGTVLVSIQERETVEWGCNFFDYDNDGDLDLYVVSGNPPALPDNTLSQRDTLYRNDGNGTFTDVTESEVPLDLEKEQCGASCSDDHEAAGFGSAVADIDNDGDLDLFVANNDFGNSRLHLNDQPKGNHWLKVRLEGLVQKFGVGARVIVTVGDIVDIGYKRQIREVISGSSYLSMDSLIQHFGLGATIAGQVKVEVQWPGGGVTTLELNPDEVDRTLVIQEAQGVCDSEDEVNPITPTNVEAVAVGAGQIQLSWKAATDNLGEVCIREYRITRNRKGATVKVSGLTYTDQTVLPETDYCYIVTAIDTAGNESEPAEAVCADTGSDTTPPSTPGGLKATALNFRDVSLTWALAEDDVEVDEYRIYRDGQLVVTLDAPPYQDKRLTTGIKYCYTVLAVDAAGNASDAQKPPSCVTPQDSVLPQPPQGLATTRVGARDMDLIWSASADDVGVEKYNIYRNGELVGEPTRVTFKDTGLSPGTAYTYLVYAVDAAGNISLSSVSLKVTTAADGGGSGGGSGGGNAAEAESDDRNETEKCFISTAALGSLMVSQLDILRAFRDQYLQPYGFGRFLVRQYYHHSPSLSRAVVGNEPLRALTRMVLWPLVGLAWMMLASPQLVAAFVVLSLLALRRYYRWMKSNA